MSSAATTSFPTLEDIAHVNRVYLGGFNGGVGSIDVDGTLLDSGNKLPAVLKAYKEQRMKGKEIDAPERPFPSHGFEELAIKEIGWQHSTKWPDTAGYWWKITCNNGNLVNNFYWTAETCNGDLRPQNKSSGQKEILFTVHHADKDIKIEGFSLQFYRNEKYEDDLCWLYEDCYAEYIECGHIKDWFEEMDRNHETRLGIGRQPTQRTIDKEEQNIQVELIVDEASEDSEKFAAETKQFEGNSSSSRSVNQESERSCCSFFSSFFRRNSREEDESHRPSNGIKR